MTENYTKKSKELETALRTLNDNGEALGRAAEAFSEVAREIQVGQSFVSNIAEALQKEIGKNGAGKKNSKRKCFISHTWAERQHGFAKILSESLNRYKGVTTWLDEDKILPGDHIFDKIDQALIEETDVFICIVSPEYSLSKNCKSELSRARALSSEKNIRLIPVLYSKSIVPLEVEGILYVDFSMSLNENGVITS